jgi:hypothetical protein
MGLFDQVEEPEPVADDPVEKNRLFETLQENTESSRNYLKLISIVIVGVIILGAVVYYLMMPGIGDQVRAPQGLEDAVRSYMQEKQKRTATDITFFKCEGYYWARVDVEERPDIKTDPVYKYSRYRAKAVEGGGTWDISASPVTDDSLDVPCSF